jgi:hypothetical protein
VTIYSITYSSLQLQNVERQLDAFLQSNRLVATWAKPFEGLYFVRTGSSQVDLYNSIRTFFPDDIPFYISLFDRNNVVGVMPQNVWNYLNTSDYTTLLSQFSTPD